jgi:hypothetical protein
MSRETASHARPVGDLARSLLEAQALEHFGARAVELVGDPTAADSDAEVERIWREYDEQIAAMDEELARKRRGAFIPGDPGDNAKKPRRTGT